MRKILLATAALALLGPSIASAQQAQGDQRQWRGRTQTQTQTQAQATAPARGAQTQPDWNAYMRNNPDLQKEYTRNRTTPGYTESQQAYAERHYREHGKAEGRALPQEAVTPPQQTQAQQRQQAQQSQQRQQGQQWSGDNRAQGRDSRPGDRNWNGARNRTGDNAWRGDRGRQDWRSDNRFRNYERNVYAQRHFRFGRYERPRGWYARRWTFGEFLPSLFWSQNYWISDYSAFGLPYPPPGCVWVRYGDDALLIDRYTGEIIQVVYNIFY